jgi:hypothetical protein
MARYFDIHPATPEQRTIAQIADIVRAGGVIAYPRTSAMRLGAGSATGSASRGSGRSAALMTGATSRYARTSPS